jgi:threonine dehydratase
MRKASPRRRVSSAFAPPSSCRPTRRLPSARAPIRSGGRIVDYDRASEDRDAVAARVLAEHGGVFIHPYNDANVIAGQGTAGLEIAEDCAARILRPDTVVIPAAAAGCRPASASLSATGFRPRPIVLVEPEGFDDYARSLREDRIVANEATSGSVCDALLAPSPGPIGFAINRAQRRIRRRRSTMPRRLPPSLSPSAN